MLYTNHKSSTQNAPFRNYSDLGAELQKIINPFDAPMTTYYGGMAGDIEFPLAALGAHGITAIDCTRPDRKPGDRTPSCADEIKQWLTNNGGENISERWPSKNKLLLEFTWEDKQRFIEYHFRKNFNFYAPSSLTEGFDIHLSRGSGSPVPEYQVWQLKKLFLGGWVVSHSDFVNQIVIQKGRFSSLPVNYEPSDIGLECKYNFTDLRPTCSPVYSVMQKTRNVNETVLFSLLASEFVDKCLISAEAVVEAQNAAPHGYKWVKDKNWREVLAAKLLSTDNSLSNTYKYSAKEDRRSMETQIAGFATTYEGNWYLEASLNNILVYYDTLSNRARQSIEPRIRVIEEHAANRSHDFAAKSMWHFQYR